MKNHLNCEYTDQERMRMTIEGILWRATIKQLTK